MRLFCAPFRNAPLLFVCVCCCFLTHALAQVHVTTWHYDNTRTGLNSQETILTPMNVTVTQFGKLFSQPVDGAIVAEPLYIPNVSIPGLGVHNVVFVVTQHDSVYAFDAASNTGGNASPLWKVNFTNPSAGVTSVPVSVAGCGATTQFTELGIVGTPAIDARTGIIYLVAETYENNLVVHRLHALNITNGQEEPGSPLAIKGSVTVNGTLTTFKDRSQMNRAGLLLLNGVVYIAFGSTGCHGNGWVMAFDATTLQQRAVFNTAPTGIGTGIWQSGGGLSADAEGNVYLATADGPFDVNTGGQDYGNSMIKLTLGTSGLSVSDYFTPYNEAALDSLDRDLGSSGLLILPNQGGSFPHLLAGGGKGGEIYLVNRDNMGQFNPAQDNVLQEMFNAPMFATPAFWNHTVYFAGGHIKAYSLNRAELLFSSQTSTLGNVFPPVISANGNTNGILWVMNSKNLLAFNPLNLSQKFYESTQAGTRDALVAVNHFITPTVANGRVYVGSTTSLEVFGLFPKVAAMSGNAQAATVGTTLPEPLRVQAMDAYTGSPIPGATVVFSDGGIGGSLGPGTTMITDESGYASAIYTLPYKAGTITVTASSPNMAAAAFVLSAASGPATRLAKISGNTQTAPAGSAFAQPLVVAALDANGNRARGATVSFSDNGAGGSFSSAEVVTDSNGTAAVQYTTPALPQNIYITASAPGVASTNFRETAQ